MTEDDDSDPSGEALVAGMPRYDAPVLDIVAKPPFLHRDTVLHGFVLQARQRALQEAIDTLFEGQGYEVASSAALLTALYVGRAESIDQEYERFGWSSETDLAFWALARGSDNRLVWIPFYMFVDSCVALVAGRELYGFPKQLARFDRDMGTVDHDPSVAVHTDFFPPSSTPTASVNQVLVRIRPGPRRPDLREDEAPKPKEIDGETFRARFTTAMGLSPSMIPDLTPPYGTPTGISVPMLFLKQLRDAAQPDRACYKAVVRLDSTTVDGHRIAIIDDPFAVDLTSNRSHDIATKLGLRSGMTTALGFVIHQNFEVNRAVVLPWK